MGGVNSVEDLRCGEGGRRLRVEATRVREVFSCREHQHSAAQHSMSRAVGSRQEQRGRPRFRRFRGRRQVEVCDDRSDAQPMQSSASASHGSARESDDDDDQDDPPMPCQFALRLQIVLCACA